MEAGPRLSNASSQMHHVGYRTQPFLFVEAPRRKPPRVSTRGDRRVGLNFYCTTISSAKIQDLMLSERNQLRPGDELSEFTE